MSDSYPPPPPPPRTPPPPAPPPAPPYAPEGGRPQQPGPYQPYPQTPGQQPEPPAQPQQSAQPQHSAQPRQWPPPHGAPAPYPPQPSGPKRSAAPIVIAAVAAVLVLAIAVLVPVLLLTGDADDPVVTGPDPDVDTSTLDAVEIYEDLDPTHQTGEIDYPQSPPVGGPHHSAWLECGAYDTQVNAENLVHDLEHGTVVISYRDDLVDADGVATLTEQLPQNGILTPWAEQDAPVVITVWGRQLDLLAPDDPRIGLFIAEYGAGETAPEPFASCAGGLTDPAGTGNGADGPVA